MPIVEQFPAPVHAKKRRELARIADRLLSNEPALRATDVFGARVKAGICDGPSVFYEDHSEIELFDESGIVNLGYRSCLLASDGDLVVLPGKRNPAFEAYCRDVLGLGRPEILVPARPAKLRHRPLADLCRHDQECFDAICKVARRQGCLNIIPYIGTGSAWVLASKVAAATGAWVHVAAPAPRLTQRANDKLWFSRLVKHCLGRDALPPTYHVFGLAALTGWVRALARRTKQIVIKVPDSSGSAGNIVLDSKCTHGHSLSEIKTWLFALLKSIGWRGRFPLMVGVWEVDVISSPSVQIWIPDSQDGAPKIEGFFSQVTRGLTGEFVGAAPCDLPKKIQDRLGLETARLACVLQELGYFGRCSFDALLTGDDMETADIHWIECNARWGGVSIPMTLANRLLGNWLDRPFVVVQQGTTSQKKRTFASALELVGGRLYRQGHPGSGVIMLTCGSIEAGTGLHFMALANNVSDAGREAEDVIRLLTRDESE